jgi:MFS transporter, UMF1 family
VLLAPYLIAIAEEAAVDDRISVLGLSVAPGSLPSYLVTFSTILSALILPPLGAMMDRTEKKKQWLAGFAWTGAAFASLLWFCRGENWQVGAVAVIGANLCLAASMVVNDSILPLISDEANRDRVSSRGWAWGYLGGGLLLAVHLVLFLGHDSFGVTEGEAVRIALASAGLWWGGFTIIPLLRLRNRRALAPGAETAGQAVVGSFRQLGRTIRELRRYPLTLGFLVAYLIYNDGVQTVISFSATYADKELGLSQTVRIAAILMVQFVAFFGALLLGRLATHWGAKRVVMNALIAWVVVVGVAYFLPRGSAVAFFALGFAIAIVMGGTQALSRSLFSHVIPVGKEAEYYSLYEISDKGSTFLGSFTLGLALQLTDSYRLGIISLVIFFVLGFVLLALIDLPKAIRAAGNPVPERI